tara:strand:- start:10 stop:177 length:168 start_codon:yes stop_codon:yes gene_type:complete
MFKGHVPKGVGVQVPLRPRGFIWNLFQQTKPHKAQPRLNEAPSVVALAIGETIKE